MTHANPRLRTMDAIIHEFTALGKLNTAKFWAEIAEGYGQIEREEPHLSHIYDHWLREACQTTGVPCHV